MIISQTPFRVSFFGGGTDFPEFYRRHGGAVLLTTIDQYCYITIHRLAPFFKHRFKANYAQTETVQRAEDFQHPLIRECLLQLQFTEGLEIAHVSDLPGRTGLGSSSSFTVGLLNALHAFRNAKASPDSLAQEAIHIERTRVGDPGGHQDQYAAAFGGFIRIDFSEGPKVVVRPVSISTARKAELQGHLMMFYTGMEQSADHILHEQRKRVDQNTAALKEMLGLVDEAENLLTGKTDISAFGQLLGESWKRKKSLSNGISNGLVDQAYESALGAGATGGKLLGAGGRGFLLLFAAPDKQTAIRQRLENLQEVPFGLSDQGSHIIFAAQEKSR
ncbi:MAG: kinase [Lentisphaerota bacterium]